MHERSVVDCRFGLGFKSPQQSVSLLIGVIREIADRTGFHDQAALEPILDSMTEPLLRLLLSRAMYRLEVRSDEVIVRLDLQFDESPEDADEADLSLLDLVPLTTDQLELWFFANEPSYARSMGFGDIEKLSTKQIAIFLSEVDAEAADLDLPPDLVVDSRMRKNGNGNHLTCDDFHA